MTASSQPPSNPTRTSAPNGAAMVGTMKSNPTKPVRNGAETAVETPRGGVSLGIDQNSACKHFKPENLVSLVQALNERSPEVIAHCVRVATLCSQWATHRRMNLDQSQLLEGLAVLHDLSFGLGSEADNEVAELSLECIDACAGSVDLQQSFALYHHWLSSSDQERTTVRTNDVIRMLAIADVYDSLTCGDVLGEGYSPKQAIQELFQSAGSTFDLPLVQDFALFLLTNEVATPTSQPDYWLELLVSLIGELSPAEKMQPVLLQDVEQVDDEEIFHRRLLDYMHQGVVMVDREMRIFEWNRAAERMTGLTQIKTLDEIWRPGLVGMMDEDGKVVSPERCPLADSIVKGMQSLRRLKLKHRDGREMVIDAHFLPVKNQRDQLCGATFMFADASQQAHLEKRVQTLHEKATRDGLTMVANRAELDRQMIEFVNTCSSSGAKGCLIITDIDRFKKVNDVYGHQAGDEALKLFAEVLRENARSTDIIARYGGEEFVVLCRDCVLEDALKKAERMRLALQSRPLPCLKGTSLTASFGVTELVPSDTCEMVIQRADEALIRAKESGRNRVLYTSVDGKPKTVQVSQPTRKETASWLSWFSGPKEEPLLSQEWLTSVPVNVVIEKMRGIVVDFHADVLSVEDSRVQFKVENHSVADIRRKADRRQSFVVDVRMVEVDFQIGRGSTPSKRTMLKLEILQHGRRDRRISNHREQVDMLARILQSYLVAQIVDENLKQHIRGGF
jgi:diguanylate cyclase (GGDEF)-like protein/PAS domain S-box-containing protein